MPRNGQELSPHLSPLHLWGSEVRRYRETVELSLDRLGERVTVTGSHIGAIERGESRCKEKLAIALDGALGANGALFALWEKTVKGAIWPEWFDWPVYEARATSLLSYQGTVVDGLLQTEDYAGVLVHGEDLARRMGRQAILRRDDPPPPHISVIIDESVLYRRIGEPAVMRAQLEHLVAIASRRVNVYVVPSEDHDGLSGSFVIARLEDGSEVAYVETAVKGFTMSGRDELVRLNDSFMSLQSQTLSLKESLALIQRTAEERWTKDQ